MADSAASSASGRVEGGLYIDKRGYYRQKACKVGMLDRIVRRGLAKIA